MKRSRQIQIQQRGPDRGRRRAADKHRCSNKEVQTEVDEEKIRQADSSRQQTTDIRKIQTDSNRFNRHQPDNRQMQADRTNQIISDA
ncbi:hypothetical protein Tco_0869534 [Tanacetum coccineum]